MKNFKQKSIAAVIGFSSIFIALAINGVLAEKQQQERPPKSAILYPEVSITETEAVIHQATVTAYGQVNPRNQLALTSQVSGQISYLSAKFLTGNIFEKGEVLAQINPIAYQQALASAQADLADAKLSLAEERLDSEQAAQEWQQSGLGDETASDLVLRKPQLVAAQAQYNYALKTVAKAQYDLKQTKITAPFNALVVSKDIQLGSNIQSGTAIADLVDTSVFEISLPLSAHQWKLLDSLQSKKTIAVTLIDEINNHQWQAYVERAEQHINDNSRQRALIAVIHQPLAQTTPLFSGTFVKAQIQGKVVDNVWQLPASALIDNNTVWQVDNEGLLHQFAVEVIFSENNVVYVKPKQASDSIRIVKRPLATYLAKMKVNAKEEVAFAVDTTLVVKNLALPAKNIMAQQANKTTPQEVR